MPRYPGVRSTITILLVGGLVAAMFVGVPLVEQVNVQSAAMLALGFFFKGLVSPDSER